MGEKMNDAEFKAKLSVLATVMALSAKEAAAQPDQCQHRLKVGINDNQCVCAVCRTVFNEPFSYGVLITGGNIGVAVDVADEPIVARVNP